MASDRDQHVFSAQPITREGAMLLISEAKAEVRSWLYRMVLAVAGIAVATLVAIIVAFC